MDNKSLIELAHIYAAAKKSFEDLTAENEKLRESLETIALHTDEDVILSLIYEALENEVQNG